MTPGHCLALATLVLGAASGCGDSSPSAAAGDVVQGRVGSLDGSSYAVLVPTGELTVEVSDPLDSLSERQTADGREREAPGGTHWIGVDWGFVPGADYDPLLRTVMDDPAVETTLTLVAAGATTELGVAPGTTGTPADTRTSGVVYIAVEADADPVVEVGFDGVTAQIDTATGDVTGDEVAALAALTDPRAEACPLTAGAGGTAEVACTATLLDVPYLAGRGWSQEGWSVVRVETRSDSFEVGGSTYEVRAVQDSSALDSALDGTVAGQSTVVTSQRGSLVTQVAAEGAAGELDVVRTLSGALSQGSGPDETTLTMTGSLDLG